MNEQPAFHENKQIAVTEESHIQPVAVNAASSTESDEGERGGSLWKSLASDLLQVVIPAMVLALIVHFFLAQATVVYGQSMEPNLQQFQRLVVDKLSYRFHSPQRDDIIVLDLPDVEEMLVKRVVGLPGETIEIHDGVVYINEVAHPDQYLHDMVAYEMAPVTLPPLYYFVLGDNRGNSNDSRSFGPVHQESIVGRVWLRYWPMDQFKIF